MLRPTLRLDALRFRHIVSTLLLWVSLTADASPATRTVCPSTCDFSTIQAAISASSDGDFITLMTFSVLTEFDIIVTASVTISGLDQQQTIVQASGSPATASGRVFTVLSGNSVTFTDLTIRHGNIGSGPGGGVWIREGASVHMERVTLADNSAVDGGGLANSGVLTMSDFSIDRNLALGGSGGGVYNDGSAGLFSGVIMSNESSTGGGIFNASQAEALDLMDMHVQANTASSSGGGIHNLGPMSVAESDVILNAADFDGGGIFNRSDVTVTMSNVRVRQNRALHPGGGNGIFTQSPLDLQDCELALNGYVDSVGGGLMVLETSASLLRCAVSFNDALAGGGIYSLAGQVTITDSAIEFNEADDHGGGIYSLSPSADLRIQNSTISSNAAGDEGGGVWVGSGTATLAHATIALNDANEGGGVYISSTASANLRSSIIADNQAVAGNYPDCAGAFSQGGFSLIGVSALNGNTPCSVNGFSSGMVSDTPALLGARQGMDATSSLELLPGSPAIDTASCTASGFTPLTDQRGAPVPVDGDNSGTAECDMGAYEYLSLTPAEQLIFENGFEVSPP